MKRLLLIILLIVSFDGISWAQNSSGQKIFDELKSLIISVADSVTPAVVHIEVVKKQDTQRYQSIGSGLIIDPAGYILTNDHVVDECIEITVTLLSNREYRAELVGSDKLTDLALIKIDVPNDVRLHSVKLGNSDSVQVGEWVIAVGNPYGFDRSVSFGIVSGKGRVLSGSSMTPLLNNFIQTDAAIAPGSSGGPLVNLKGEVIGVNSRGLGQNQGFTIPINIAIEVKNKLLSSGTIDRGWLGIVSQPLNRSYANYLGKPDMEGILISDILKDSPADKAGLRQGDVILSYGNDKLSAEKEEDINKLTLLISQSAVGAEKSISIYRDGKIENIKVEIGRQPKVKADEYETDLGFTVKEITDNMFRNYLLQTKNGVYVSFVDVGTMADKADLSDGDIITAVDKKKVADIAGFKSAIASASKSNFILLSVTRGKEQKLALLDRSSVPADKKSPEESPGETSHQR